MNDRDIEDTLGEITSIAGYVYKDQVRRIEEFAAAYFQKTRLDPTKAKLVSRQTLTDTGVKLEYWFEPFPSGSEIEIYRARAEAAERELAALRERYRWVRVSERLPENGQHVYAREDNGNITLFLYKSILRLIFMRHYTHWQPLPLPEPPESA